MCLLHGPLCTILFFEMSPYIPIYCTYLDDVKSLSLPGTYNEKISSLGTSLNGFTRLKSLDLSRNALVTTEVIYLPFLWQFLYFYATQDFTLHVYLILVDVAFIHCKFF